jgi:hypothetical protein
MGFGDAWVMGGRSRCVGGPRVGAIVRGCILAAPVSSLGGVEGQFTFGEANASVAYQINTAHQLTTEREASGL